MALYWLLFAIALGSAAGAHSLLLQERDADRSAIDLFAKQNRLRVISIVRSSNYFYSWVRGITVGSFVRRYGIDAEDSEGNRGEIRVAFDALFGSGQLQVLDQRGFSFA